MTSRASQPQPAEPPHPRPMCRQPLPYAPPVSLAARSTSLRTATRRVQNQSALTHCVFTVWSPTPRVQACCCGACASASPSPLPPRERDNQQLLVALAALDGLGIANPPFAKTTRRRRRCDVIDFGFSNSRDRSKTIKQGCSAG